jgi:hypothetical protein
MPLWYHKAYGHWQSITHNARDQLYAKYALLSPQHFGFGPGDDQAAARRALYELVAYPASVKGGLEKLFFDTKNNPCDGAENLILTLHPYKVIRLYQIFHCHYLGVSCYHSPASTIPVITGACYVYPGLSQEYIQSWCNAGLNCNSAEELWSLYMLKLSSELTTLLQSVTPGTYVPHQAECDRLLTLTEPIARVANYMCNETTFQTELLKYIRSYG